jgi:hypothetical protein
MSLMNTLMLSCRKATQLMEQRSMAPLGTMDRMQLWMHLRVCDGCRAYQKQNTIIDRMMEQRKGDDQECVVLEERILKAVEKKGADA